MANNDLVANFDFDNDDSLLFVLQNLPVAKQTILVALKGYIDTYNSAYFSSQMDKILEAGFLNIVFDCSNLEYVSSTGIGVFSALMKKLKLNNGNIVLFGLQSKVSEIFQLLGFTQLFNIKNTKEEASAFFSQEVQMSISIFPLIFACPVCSKRLRASNAGRFRCSECKSILAVDINGQVSLG